MPVVDEVAGRYQGEVDFLAVAGRSDLGRTTEQADKLLDIVPWGLDDSIWELFGDPYQPYTVLITADGKIFEAWFGALDEAELSTRIDALIAVHS
ncbi:MAG: hypothetical protein HKN93_05175 [Acidimicrobiia bacterium]|nr:hypothetical protein [Acidimicrobiia bacterium]